MADKIILTAEQIELVEKLAGQGLNVNQMAAILGISKATLDRRAADTPELHEAIEKGRAEAANKVTKVAYQMAVSGKSPVMTIFWLKCRERWRDVNAHEHSGPDGKPIESVAKDALTDEQLDTLIKGLIEKRGGGSVPA